MNGRDAAGAGDTRDADSPRTAPAKRRRIASLSDATHAWLRHPTWLYLPHLGNLGYTVVDDRPKCVGDGAGQGSGASSDPQRDSTTYGGASSSWEAMLPRCGGAEAATTAYDESRRSGSGSAAGCEAGQIRGRGAALGRDDGSGRLGERHCGRGDGAADAPIRGHLGAPGRVDASTSSSCASARRRTAGQTGIADIARKRSSMEWYFQDHAATVAKRIADEAARGDAPRRLSAEERMAALRRRLSAKISAKPPETSDASRASGGERTKEVQKIHLGACGIHGDPACDQPKDRHAGPRHGIGDVVTGVAAREPLQRDAVGSSGVGAALAGAAAEEDSRRASPTAVAAAASFAAWHAADGNAHGRLQLGGAEP